MKDLKEVLPDVLRPDLLVVICGIAAGSVSARTGAYYADAGNMFWKVVHRSGLLPQPLQPSQFAQVIRFGIGLTDIVKNRFGAGVTPTDSDIESFRKKMIHLRPKIVAFNGMQATESVFEHPVAYGWYHEGAAVSKTFVLPSTSGMARRYWDEAYWIELGSVVSRYRNGEGQGV